MKKTAAGLFGYWQGKEEGAAGMKLAAPSGGRMAGN